MMEITRCHHIAIAVKDLGAARTFFHPKDTFGAMLGFGEFKWLNF